MSKTFQNKLTQSLIIVTKRRKMSKWFNCLGIKFASLISPNLTIFITLWITMKLKGIIQRRKKRRRFHCSVVGVASRKLYIMKQTHSPSKLASGFHFYIYTYTEESYWKKARAHFKYIKKKVSKSFILFWFFYF